MRYLSIATFLLSLFTLMPCQVNAQTQNLTGIWQEYKQPAFAAPVPNGSIRLEIKNNNATLFIYDQLAAHYTVEPTGILLHVQDETMKDQIKIPVLAGLVPVSENIVLLKKKETPTPRNNDPSACVLVRKGTVFKPLPPPSGCWKYTLPMNEDQQDTCFDLDKHIVNFKNSDGSQEIIELTVDEDFSETPAHQLNLAYFCTLYRFVHLGPEFVLLERISPNLSGCKVALLSPCGTSK